MLRRLGLALCALLTFLNGITEARKHLLSLPDDERPVIVITSFGYLEGGYLKVEIINLKILPISNLTPLIGFSFDKSSSSGSSSYVERAESSHRCVLEDTGGETFEDVPRAILKIERVDADNSVYQLKVKDRNLNGLQFFSNKSDYEAHTASPEANSTSTPTETPTKKIEQTEKNIVEKNDDVKPASSDGETTTNDDIVNDLAVTVPSRRKRAAVPAAAKPAADPGSFTSRKYLPISGNYVTGMNFTFYVQIDSKDQIGLYELYFHNCQNSRLKERASDYKPTKVWLTAKIVEKNGDSYLSAGDMALPAMYGIISAMFFIVGIVWIRWICLTEERVFKIHQLMAVIILIKGLSVMFHSLDYFFIAKDGRTEAWAVIYYIVHLLKGILLIVCLLLIGTGWAFIKYILSDREKKLFLFVIPMQVMANVAYIIMEETEEGNKSYYTWKNIVILVDVLCCGAILLPVVWSIRHLQKASETDGKAAISLAKLELFRQFYIMVVCYLYFTRIIVYLLELTLPFHYLWIHAFFSELGAFVFFSVTGYKFRPGCDNPYLKLEQYDSDDPEEAITQSGATENITRVNKHDKDVSETDEFDVLLPKQRSSKV